MCGLDCCSDEMRRRGDIITSHQRDESRSLESGGLRVVSCVVWQWWKNKIRDLAIPYTASKALSLIALSHFLSFLLILHLPNKRTNERTKEPSPGVTRLSLVSNYRFFFLAAATAAAAAAIVVDSFATTDRCHDAASSTLLHGPPLLSSCVTTTRFNCLLKAFNNYLQYSNVLYNGCCCYLSCRCAMLLWCPQKKKKKKKKKVLNPSSSRLDSSGGALHCTALHRLKQPSQGNKLHNTRNSTKK